MCCISLHCITLHSISLHRLIWRQLEWCWSDGANWIIQIWFQPWLRRKVDEPVLNTESVKQLLKSKLIVPSFVVFFRRVKRINYMWEKSNLSLAMKILLSLDITGQNIFCITLYNVCGHPFQIVTIRSWHGGETDKVDISKHPDLISWQEITHKANKPALPYKEEGFFLLEVL